MSPRNSISLAVGAAAGIAPEFLHRVTSVAAGVLDILPLIALIALIAVGTLFGSF